MTEIKKEKILAYALENAILHNGKARESSIINRLFQEGLKKENIKNIIKEVKDAVNSVNALPLEEQKRQLIPLKDLLKKREIRVGLPPLPNAEKGKVVLRIAPFPSGPLHIGNSRIAIINDEYAKMYNGNLILVIDDTIGSKEKQIEKEAYKLIPDSLDFLNIKYEKKIIYKSKRLPIYYKYAEQLIKKGVAYVCLCSSQKLRKNRKEKKECKCRLNNIGKNSELWKNMLKNKFKAGKAILRIKTSMQHKNPAFRDRVLFRISDRPHPKTKKKYSVWPLLEFSWAIDDYLLGITHILRGKELEIEGEMEKLIWQLLGFPQKEMLYLGLLNIKGIKISKSKSRAEVKSGKYSGWDDPRTWSLQSLERRGIKADAIRKFILSLGITKTEVNVPIDILYTENRKFIEDKNRYTFIEEPKKISIKKAPEIKAEIPLHPNHRERGSNLFKTKGDFFISLQDYKDIRKKKGNYRFMYLYNFNHKFEFLSIPKNKKLKAKSIHWLPSSKTEKHIKTEILMPDGKILKGLSEDNISKLKLKDIIQFRRFGFCRLDNKGSKTKPYKFWYAHN